MSLQVPENRPNVADDVKIVERVNRTGLNQYIFNYLRPNCSYSIMKNPYPKKIRPY